MSETASPTFAGQVRTVLNERQREIALMLTLAFSTFSLLALFGFQEADTSLLNPGTGKVENPCGPLGANLAAGLFFLFGIGAYSIFLVMVGAVLSLARRTSVSWTQSAWGLVVFSSSLAGVAMFGDLYAPTSPGGWLGRSQRIALESLVGPMGTVLVIGTILTLSATVLFEIRWTRVFEALARQFDKATPVARAAGVKVGGVAVTFGRATAKWSGRQLVSGAEKAAVKGGVFRENSWKVLQRMGRSLIRKEGDYSTDVEWIEASGVHEKTQVADGFPFHAPPDHDRTVAASPSPVAEVQWEPTAATPSASDRSILDMFAEVSPRSVQRATATEGPFDEFEGDPDHTQASENDAPTIPVEPEEHWQQRAAPSPKSQPFLLGIPVTGAESEVNELERTPVMSERVCEPVHAASSVTSHQVVERSNRPPESEPIKVDRPSDSVIQIAAVEKLGERVRDDGGVINARTKSNVFKLPKLSLLDLVPEQKASFNPEELRELALLVESTLASFKVDGEVTDVRVGPVVTIFEFLPASGVSVRKIANLSDDLCMALRATSVRIVAPIPGKGVVGIEIPSTNRLTIYLRELMASDQFRSSDMALPCVIGKDVEGGAVVTDLAKMPHLLIGGTTGSGKSVGVNGILLSLLYTSTPDSLRLLLIDPKKLEFKLYEGIPHLLHPVVTEAKGAAAALAWACREMDQRYELLARWDTRNIVNYNNKVERELKSWTKQKALKYAPPGWSELEPPPKPEKMPYIVIIIDELADLMMVAKNEVQDSIVRLAQMARACGIHIVLATQRPSVDVITGLIKSNMPTRMAFKLRSNIDSRTVLDAGGAEKLLGRGDLLMLPNAGDIVRCHGAFISDEEVDRVTSFWRDQGAPEYIEMTMPAEDDSMAALEEDRDPMFDQAVEVVVRAGKASTSLVQRQLRIGYNRAARIIESMEMAGVIGPPDGAKPREVLIGPASIV